MPAVRMLSQTMFVSKPDNMVSLLIFIMEELLDTGPGVLSVMSPRPGLHLQNVTKLDTDQDESQTEHRDAKRLQETQNNCRTRHNNIKDTEETEKDDTRGKATKCVCVCVCVAPL